MNSKKKVVPSYEERCRAALEASKKKQRPRLFVPRSVQDFEDGGAFPEIHVAQYPRNMGNPHLSKSTMSTAIVATNNNSSSGSSSVGGVINKKTQYQDLVPMQASSASKKKDAEEDMCLPNETEERALMERTLATVLTEKKEDDHATTKEQQFISYTPRPDAPGYNPMAAPKRVIQMVRAQVDPMAPPKHIHRKAPRGPAEEFTPVLHGKPKKLSEEEKASWNIPACISNWKNTRGYTIPLDKRLAADGRGLTETTVLNTNFATLSESLYVAERQARQEVKMRAQVQHTLALQQKQTQEDHLRELAKQARQQRTNTTATTTTTTTTDATASGTTTSAEKDDDMVAAQQRERLRMQRKKERERDYRMEKLPTRGKEGEEDLVKKRKLESDRDVSEKIALGVHTASSGNNNDGVDSRLYNTSQGLDSGYAGPDDEYNTYSKPLFDQTVHANIYKPTTTVDADTQYQQYTSGTNQKFTKTQQSRTGPVQFHKST